MERGDEETPPSLTNPPILFAQSHQSHLPPSTPILLHPPSNSLILPNILPPHLQPQVVSDIHDLVGLSSAPPPGPIHNSINDQVMPTMLETAPEEAADKGYVNIKDKIMRGGSSSSGKNKKNTEPKVVFQTKSPDDILDDGYRWRKYGQKSVKNSKYPRSYYRCSHHTCNVKKQIQRLSKDTSIVVTSYEGVHNHPCEKLMEALSPLLKQMQFLTRF